MDNCIFCMIIEGKTPSRRVYEDENCIAMLDINPATPGHTLILPKEHHQDLTEMNEALLGKLMMTARKITHTAAIGLMYSWRKDWLLCRAVFILSDI